MRYLYYISMVHFLLAAVHLLHGIASLAGLYGLEDPGLKTGIWFAAAMLFFIAGVLWWLEADDVARYRRKRDQEIAEIQRLAGVAKLKADDIRTAQRHDLYQQLEQLRGVQRGE
jgi:hypothetical protein